MATRIESSVTTFDANTADTSFVMDVEAQLITLVGGDGVDASQSLGGRVFQIDGKIDASVIGIRIVNDPAAAPDRIVIGATGLVDGNDGAIRADEGDVRVQNKGRLLSLNGAIDAECERFALRNSGVIEGSGTNTILSDSDFTSLNNAGSILADTFLAIGLNGEFNLVNSGLIQSLSGDAIKIAFTAAASGTILNTGTIFGGDEAILTSGLANDIEIVNRGSIFGDINLAGTDGVNVIDNTRGRIAGDITGSTGVDRLLLHKESVVTGSVSGGAGDDIYIVGSPNVTIVEGAGNNTDTVRSFASFSFVTSANLENLVLLGTRNIDGTGNAKANVITGNVGDNELDGGSDADTLRGGKGKDILTGGLGADVFIYRTGDGKDRITDFAVDDDIDLTGLVAVKSVNDLFNNHIFADGDDVLIKGPGGDVIRLKDVTVDELSGDQFII